MSKMITGLTMILATLVACSDPSGGPDAGTSDDAGATTDAMPAADAAPTPAVGACAEQPEPAVEYVYEDQQVRRALSHVRAAAGTTGIGVLWMEDFVDDRERMLFGIANGDQALSSVEEIWAGEPGENVFYAFVQAIDDTYVVVFDVWNGDFGEPDFQGRVMAMAIAAEGDTLSVGPTHVTLANGVAPYAAAIGDRVGVIAAEISDADAPTLVFTALDDLAETQAPPTVLIDDLFGPTLYDWFGLVAGPQDYQLIVRREEDQALFTQALGDDGQPAGDLRDLGVSASFLGQHALAGVDGEMIAMVSGDGPTLHMWDWNGTHRFSGGILEASTTLRNVASWRGRLGVFFETLSEDDDDAIDLHWQWLAASSGLVDKANQISTLTVYRDGAVLSGYHDGPIVVHGDRLHVFVPSTVDEDGMDGGDEEYRIDHVTACIR